MKQLKASMPDELAERLEKASAKSGRSLSAEICARVEQTFAQEAAATSDFIQDVALMAAEIAREPAPIGISTPAPTRCLRRQFSCGSSRSNPKALPPSAIGLMRQSLPTIRAN